MTFPTRRLNTLTRGNIVVCPVTDPDLILEHVTGHKWEWNPAKRQRMLNRITRLRSNHAQLASTGTTPAVG